MTSTPQFRRVLLAMAAMAEGIAKAARLLAAGQDAEAGEPLLSIRHELDEKGGA